YGLEGPAMVKIATNLLRGQAAIWWLAVECDIRANVMNPIITWEEFKRILKLEYEPRDYQYELRSCLHKLYQNKHTVASYAAEFRKTALMISNITNDEMVHAFIDHLNHEIALHVVDKNPKTLSDAITRAQQVEDNLYRYGDKKKEKDKDKGK